MVGVTVFRNLQLLGQFPVHKLKLSQGISPSAVIYILIESCNRRGLKPYAYLKDILTRLPKMTIIKSPK